MSLIRTIIGGLLLLLAAAFVFWLVYSNAQLETIKLAGLFTTGIPNPFAGPEGDAHVNLPLGMWFILFTIFGVFVGLFAGWFMAGESRVRARQKGRQARVAEKELATVKKQAETAKTEIDSLKTEKKDLEVKVTEAIAAPADAKQIANS